MQTPLRLYSSVLQVSEKTLKDITKYEIFLLRFRNFTHRQYNNNAGGVLTHAIALWVLSVGSSILVAFLYIPKQVGGNKYC
jgi:hypothetical protein